MIMPLKISFFFLYRIRQLKYSLTQFHRLHTPLWAPYLSRQKMWKPFALGLWRGCQRWKNSSEQALPLRPSQTRLRGATLSLVFSMPVHFLDAHQTEDPWCIRASPNLERRDHKHASESLPLKHDTVWDCHPQCPEERQNEWAWESWEVNISGRESQCVRVWPSELLNQRELNQAHSLDRWMSRRGKKIKGGGLSFKLFFILC